MLRQRLFAIARSTVFQSLVLVVVLAGMVWVLADRWNDVAPELRRFDSVSLSLSVVLAMAATITTAWMWKTSLEEFGATAPLPLTLQLYGLTLPAKYVPGGVWTVAVQAQIAARLGTSRRAGVASSALATVFGVGTAALVTLVGAPLGLALGSTMDAGSAGLWASGLVVLVGALLVSPALVNVVARRILGPHSSHRISHRSMARLAALGLLNWVLLGAHLAMLVRRFDTSIPVALFCVTAFAASWLMGFVAVFAPAGAGARDVAMVVVFSGVLPGEQALALALASRLALIVADLLGTLCGIPAIRSSRDGLQTPRLRSSDQS